MQCFSGICEVKHFLFVFQLQIYAYDSVFPDQRATSTVTISIVHNPSTPVIQGSYQTTVPETWGFGDPIFNISASDDDGVSKKGG